MGFVGCKPHRDGVGLRVRGYMSATRALCCVGRGGAARGPVDRGVFLRMVVGARWSGLRGSVLCRRRAWVWSVELFGRLSVVLCDDVGPRLWGLLRDWVHGTRKTVTVDVGARP